MTKRRKDLSAVLKILLHVPLLLLVYILQDMIFVRLPVFGACPLLLPLAAAAVALFEGSIRGGVFGLFAGILCDASLGEPAIAFTILLTVCGLAVGALGETVMVRGFPSFALCAAAVLLVSILCQMFSFLVFDAVPLSALAGTALAEFLYSLLFALPVYLPARSLSRAAGA